MARRSVVMIGVDDERKNRQVWENKSVRKTRRAAAGGFSSLKIS